MKSKFYSALSSKALRASAYVNPCLAQASSDMDAKLLETGKRFMEKPMEDGGEETRKGGRAIRLQ